MWPTKATLVSIGVGVVWALFLTRHFFQLPSETFFENHENDSFLLRMLEFRDCLAAGYPFPQWCSHFRTGLGSPYFSYYQPGFFYVTSVFLTFVGPVRAAGLTLWLFASLGYIGMLRIVGPRFGVWAGVLAGGLLLGSSYAGTNLYVRGDFSEFAAMMLIPWCLAWLLECLESGGVRATRMLAVSSGLLIVTHPVMGLLGYGLGVGVTIWHSIAGRSVRWAAAGGWLGGIGLSAFYWFPVFFEWSYVDPQAAFQDYYHYSKHFVAPWQIVDRSRTLTPIPVKLGLAAILWPLLGATMLLLRRRTLTAPQRRVAVMGVVGVTASLFLMSSASQRLWDVLPFLHRAQFPWRLLSTLAIAGAWLGGGVGLFLDAGKRRAVATIGLALALSNCWFASRISTAPLDLPTNAAGIAGRYFAPDIADEWLPRGAKGGKLDAQAPRVIASAGATVGPLELSQGRLACDVSASGKARYLLMHYYFPRGWHATLDGRPTPLTRSEKGLMRIEVDAAATGRLELRFTATPMRRWGVAVSGVTLAALLGGAVALRRRSAAAGSAATSAPSPRDTRAPGTDSPPER